MYHHTSVEAVDGVPHPGKGTASYNCGEDRLWSIGIPGHVGPEAAADEFCRVVLRCRERWPL